MQDDMLQCISNKSCAWKELICQKSIPSIARDIKAEIGHENGNQILEMGNDFD